MKKYLIVMFMFVGLFLGYESLLSVQGGDSRMIDYPYEGGYSHYYDGGTFGLYQEEVCAMYVEHLVAALSDGTPMENCAIPVYDPFERSDFSNFRVTNQSLNSSTHVAFVRVAVTFTGSGHPDELGAQHTFDCDEVPFH